jgi:protein-S-isoprenylcysteine O-methyltransferase Ste14
MDRSFLIRAASLYVPLMSAAWLWFWRRPPRTTRAGMLLATLWNFSALSAIAALAPRLDWWQVHARGALFLGMPVDLLAGWAILWGILPLLLLPRTPIAVVVAFFFAFDLSFMPRLQPVLELQPHWLIGEAVALFVSLLPSLLLARWTRDGSHLCARASLQVLLFSGLVTALLPTLILVNTGGGWIHVLARPFWLNAILLQLLAPFALLGLSAVQEFATRGGGTPLPYDPPKRLVTSGFYAYVANPMQLAAMLLLAGWGWFLGNWWVAAASVMAHIYSAGLAAWDEEDDVGSRFGDRWHAYRNHVRAWIPRWKPWHWSLADENAPRATLYIAASCGPCSEVKLWFELRSPVGLEIAAAENVVLTQSGIVRADLSSAQNVHGRPLGRISYVAGEDATPEQGIAAVARALEHLNFAWAMVGCAIRLPLVRPALQLLIDASGGGPRTIVLPAPQQRVNA